MKPPVIPIAAPRSVSHGVRCSRFLSSYKPSVKTPTAATSRVVAAMYGAALR